MKYFKYVKILLMALIIYTISSCNDMNSIHQEYLDRGETVYTAGIDSVKYDQGFQQVRFFVYLKADPRITALRINWVEGATSKEREVSVVRTSGEAPIVDVTISNIPEGDYNFKFITRDNDGHRSVAREHLVTVPGENFYVQGLASRPIEAATTFGNVTAIKWAPAQPNTHHSEITYSSLDGTIKTFDLLTEQTETLLNDYLGGLQGISVYKSESVSDLFSSKATIYTVINKACTLLKSGTIIPAIDFDYGGEGVAYHDNDAANNGGNNYRASIGDTNCGVDIENNRGISHTNAGEWQMFTINVADAGNYVIDCTNSVNSASGADAAFEVDGVMLPAMHFENNGSLDDWRFYFEERHPEYIPQRVYLSAGIHKLKFVCLSGGFNYRNFKFSIPRTNVALNKPATESDFRNPGENGVNAVDGVKAGGGRWVTAGGDHWLEIDLQAEYPVDGFQVWTGNGTSYTQPITNFELQAWVGSQWVTVHSKTGNGDPLYSADFNPVTTSKVRLFVKNQEVRLFEIEIYATL